MFSHFLHFSFPLLDNTIPRVHYPIITLQTQMTTNHDGTQWWKLPYYSFLMEFKDGPHELSNRAKKNLFQASHDYHPKYWWQPTMMEKNGVYMLTKYATKFCSHGLSDEREEGKLMQNMEKIETITQPLVPPLVVRGSSFHQSKYSENLNR